MRHVHPLRFESLEARQLLSRAHGPAPARPRVAAAPLVLDGTLAVDNSPGAATTTMNIDGSMTTSVPVAGQLGALGQVHGLWNESVDAYGDYQGPDTLRLRDAKGTFTVEFNNGTAVRPHGKSRGALSYEHNQMASGGAGAYARASESGSIVLTTNAGRTEVVSITLHTRNT